MKSTIFLLVHSPLLSPYSWSLVGAELEKQGYRVLLPDLQDDGGISGPLWEQHVRSAVSAIPAQVTGTLIIAGHSGAGLLLPAIRQAYNTQVCAYLFVDAGVPRASGLHQRLDQTIDEDRKLLELIKAHGRFPAWTVESLEPVLPNLVMRERLVAELRPRPLIYWQEFIPVSDGWPDSPCGYLHFSPAYNRDADYARQHGWPLKVMIGSHFDLLHKSDEVAEAMATLAEMCQQKRGHD